LADFLREIRDVTIVSRQFRQQLKSQPKAEPNRRADADVENLPDLTLENAERALYMLENDEHSIHSSQRGIGEDGFDIDTGGELSPPT
jgi:vacuole morphology and inheritance protein 14